MKFLSRKEEIVLSTISLIHEMGVSNISMKEIAKRERVTEASLYKHFKSKDELLNAVITYYEHYDDLIHKTLNNSDDKAINNIIRYFSIYAEYYNNYKEITALINTYSVLAYDKNFSERSVKRMEEKKYFVEAMIMKSQDDKEWNREVKADSMAYILLGSFDRIITTWRLLDYPFSLIDKTEEVIGDIIAAYKIKNDNSE